MSPLDPFAMPAVLVSDHAVLRWLERVCGVDIESYREEIRAAFVAGGLGYLGGLADAAGIYVDVPEYNVHLVVRDGQVTSVFHSGSEPEA